MLTPRSYFQLSGDFDPDDITRRLASPAGWAMSPSWVAKIGDAGPPGALGTRDSAEWCWYGDDDESCNAGDQLAYFVGALRPHKEQIALLATAFNGVLQIYSCSAPGKSWFLSSAALKELASMNVDVSCDQIDPSSECEVL